MSKMAKIGVFDLKNGHFEVKKRHFRSFLQKHEGLQAIFVHFSKKYKNYLQPAQNATNSIGLPAAHSVLALGSQYRPCTGPKGPFWPPKLRVKIDLYGLSLGPKCGPNTCKYTCKYTCFATVLGPNTREIQCIFGSFWVILRPKMTQNGPPGPLAGGPKNH